MFRRKRSQVPVVSFRGAQSATMGRAPFGQAMQMYQGAAATMMPGVGAFGSSTLSAGDVAYLKDRALRFASNFDQLLQHPQGTIVSQHDGRELVAVFSAQALVGDDYNYATGQPSAGFSTTKWQAAYDLVYGQVESWWAQYVGATPLPVPPA